MPRPRPAPAAALGLEERLWRAADTLRGQLEPSAYKHLVLGLFFLQACAAPGCPLEVPEEARWPRLRALAEGPGLAGALDAALVAIESRNVTLHGCLRPVFVASGIDEGRLADLVRGLDGALALGVGGPGGEADAAGRIYEYLLSKFATAEGRGGEYYTPGGLVRLLVALIEPLSGVVYDPCCGTGGMFVQSVRFQVAHGRRAGDVQVFGQESNETTWRMARVNLALRGISASLGAAAKDTLSVDLHPGLQADFVLANPPFNVSDWGGARLRGDPRWAFGPPPVGNANFAWLQHIAHHLGPGGQAAVILANGSMTGRTGGEAELRRSLVEADLVDCMVALPDLLFTNTPIPACVWILHRDKAAALDRDRRGELLFIDARGLGRLEGRASRVLDPVDVERVAQVYRAWRRRPAEVEEGAAPAYVDLPGFCRSASRAEVAANDFGLNPGRYVGAEAPEAEGAPFLERAGALAAELRAQQAAAQALDRRIEQTLAAWGL
jgi:type I restriction enzyme M protein